MKKITLSGIVGWDFTGESIRRELDDAAGGDVELLISSPGGYVSDCLEIANLVRSYPGRVTARLVGFAMSAASYIPLFADHVIAEDNAVYMMHNVQGGVWGDHNAILKYGNLTRDLSAMMAKQYVRFTGKDQVEIAALLDAESYFCGQAIIDAGFAHELAESTGDDDETSAMAVARTTFAATASRLAADITATAADLTRAVSMAPSFTTQEKNPKKPTQPTNRATAPVKQPPSQEKTMDLKTLKEKHQDLVAAITDEVTASMTATHTEQLTAARTEATAAGAEQERLRIADVRAQLIPGHESLVETMAADGKSTGADAAKAIVAAEKALRAQVADGLTNSANPVVPPAVPPAGDVTTMSRMAFTNLDTKAQREFIGNGGIVTDQK